MSEIRLNAEKIKWQNAPDGCTHLDPEDLSWMRLMNGQWYEWDEDDSGWFGPLDNDSFVLNDVEAYIARPTKPEPQEWSGDGLPPVGAKCEIKTRSTTEWLPVTIKYISPQGVVAETESGLDAFISCTNGPEYRPIKSGAERDRENLHELLLPAVRQLKHNDGSGGFVFAYDPEEALTILSKYNLTPKDDQ